MPTFRNTSERTINYETGGKIYNFPSGKDTSIKIWIPYKELGLELISENYPPVQSKILISGTFKFSAGSERKINIDHCDRYRVRVKVKSGKVRFYAGSSLVGVEISGEYDTVLEWQYAPYIRITGLEAGTIAELYGEVEGL